MEEEKSVEIPETREPLWEQGSIRTLLELLEQQGMEQEKGDVLRMADYIDSMETQLGTVLKELGEVKNQLSVMQESKTKRFAVNTIQKVEHQVETLRSQVGEWKRKFVERAEQAVFDLKEKGKDALACAVKGMHLTQGLQKIQSSLHTVMLSMDQKIDRLGSMAEELHVAKGHLRNAFLEAGGKEVRKLTERNPEQGILFQTQKVLFQSMRSIHKQEQKTERLQQQIGKLEERQGKQVSLKDTLQELRQEQHPLKPGKEEKQKSAVR
jgi:cob(I)alamin adenosyltransferase